jgi:hypothetical protein
MTPLPDQPDLLFEFRELTQLGSDQQATCRVHRFFARITDQQAFDCGRLRIHARRSQNLVANRFPGRLGIEEQSNDAGAPLAPGGRQQTASQSFPMTYRNSQPALHIETQRRRTLKHHPKSSPAILP